jgi:hypothetical protein
MLDVGLAVGAGSCKIQTVRRREKRRQVFIDFRAPAAALLDVGVSIARSLAGLAVNV